MAIHLTLHARHINKAPNAGRSPYTPTSQFDEGSSRFNSPYTKSFINKAEIERFLLHRKRKSRTLLIIQGSLSWSVIESDLTCLLDVYIVRDNA
jgi:hypothetical protein